MEDETWRKASGRGKPGAEPPIPMGMPCKEFIHDLAVEIVCVMMDVDITQHTTNDDRYMEYAKNIRK